MLIEWEVWAPGHELVHTISISESEARKAARYWLGLEKLPKGTIVEQCHMLGHAAYNI